jgi:predicted nucleotide-binding protein
MNLLFLVQECIRDIDENQKPLSMVLQKCIRIAYLLNDIESYMWLRMESMNYDEELQHSSFQYEINMLVKNMHIPFEKVKGVYNKQQLLYIESRKVYFQEGKFYGHSIMQLENLIEASNQQLERNVVPNGLHSLDLFYVNKEKNEIDALLFQGLTSYKGILNNIKARVYEFLIKTEGKLMDKTITTLNSQPLNKNVFIIHGHNEAKWRELRGLLKDDFGLNPIVLKEQPDRGSQSIIDKFEYYASTCSYAFAIFTPDDIIENSGVKYFQARPNVIFEMGWFSSFLGRRNLCIMYFNLCTRCTSI